MNRNERRAAERTKAKNAGHKPAAARAESLKAQGMALKSAGKDAEAAPLLIEALKADSSLADVHFMLAMMSRHKPELHIDIDRINKNVTNKNLLCKSYLIILNILKGKKQYREALVCQEELCRLMPDNMDEKANLALLYNLDAQREKALETLAEIMMAAPDEKKYKGLFLSLMGPVILQKHNPLLMSTLQQCFDNIYEANLSKAFPVWIKLVMNDPGCSDLQAVEMLVGQDEFDRWTVDGGPEQANFLASKFFLDGVRLLIITDTVLELFLTRARRWLCLEMENLAQAGKLEKFHGFLCALGEQCFLNEYIYSYTAGEETALENLIALTREDSLGAISKEYAYALISCYRPLIDVFPKSGEELSMLAKNNEKFAQLVKVQFDDPRTEREIKKHIETFGVMQNEVSQKVQQQYEEHPYPRWNSINNYPSPNDDLPFPIEQRNKPFKILVAGCGTGRHAISTAACYPNAHVTAIDLSRASLAYAQRKAREAGLAERISFIHADILNMKDWQGTFDIIESAGVLHHMEDPFLGWQTLNDLLVPGGYFKVGLYSELARAQIVEARNFVTQGGYPATDEGIRRCRADILALPTTDPMRKKLLSFIDFYSTSLLRDLIFHVQEHRMTLPQIDGMMQKLGLRCLSVNITQPELVAKYDKMFPQDLPRANLLNWHEFEQKFPDTFAGMYQFWCQKQV